MRIVVRIFVALVVLLSLAFQIAREYTHNHADAGYSFFCEMDEEAGEMNNEVSQHLPIRLLPPYSSYALLVYATCLSQRTLTTACTTSCHGWFVPVLIDISRLNL